MSIIKKILDNTLRWIDTEAKTQTVEKKSEAFNWIRCIPFIILHAACLGVIWVGWSATAVYFAIGFYFFRVFAVTAFYHRYFSHRSFKTSRPAQFIFAVLGATSVQRGALWWAAHHRVHHQYADTDKDLHSPRRGFWWSHMGWFTCEASFDTQYHRIKDFSKFPELRFLNRYDMLIPVLTGVTVFFIGHILYLIAPELGTSGLQLLVWGFFISTIALFHTTVVINSVAHVWGSQRYATNDDSKNNWLLALLTFGEGWHNNHHRWPTSARQGFFWWEIDITFYILKVMSWMGIIWDLNPVPKKLLQPSVDSSTRSSTHLSTQQTAKNMSSNGVAP